MSDPLKYEPLKLAPMQQWGSSLLKALQNDSMVPLDLLVRESIQNSLDAASSATKPVRVAFEFALHSSESVAALLGYPVAEPLRACMGPTARLLVIRDSNTCGLTGKVRLSDHAVGEQHGNFIKLVYEVGRSQEERKKGGSWGLGKTVYFRIGCGLVFYYSRIREGGRLSERLAACLVENEKSPKRLQRENATGIGWWGSGDGPVCDEIKVHRALASLGVKPFSGEETGTCIIVPFLRDDLGPPASHPEDQEGEEQPAVSQPYWHKSYEEYISVATQRWYGIRLNNRRYREGPPLEVSVNGTAISQQLPLFQLAQNLYNCCDGTASSQVVPGAGSRRISVHVEEIGNMRVAVEGSTGVGRLASALVTPDELGMGNPDNAPSPHLCLNGRESVGAAPPIVAFLRGHGMVIRWDAAGGSHGWAKGCGATTGRFLVAVVVPIGRLVLHKRALAALKHDDSDPLLLEGYLRSCEKADHHQWTDPVGVTIVARMKERVAEKLRARVPQLGPTAASVTPFLAARTLADLLLPEGFGTDGRKGPSLSPQGEGGDLRNRLGKTPHLEVRRVQYRGGGLLVEWALTWRTRKLAPCSMDLLVDTEGRPMGAAEWETYGLGRFPFLMRKTTAKAVGLPGPGAGAVAVKNTPLRGSTGILIAPSGELAKGVKSVTVEGATEVDFVGNSGSPVAPVLNVSSPRTTP